MLNMNDKRSGSIRSLADLLAEKNIILTDADAFTEKGFTQVPNAILRTSKLSMGAMTTFIVTVADQPIANIGAPFWAIVFGLAVSYLFERQDRA